MASTLENQKDPNLFSNIFAGAICGLMTVIAAISYATLVFSGSCAPYLQLGIVSALISATVIGFFMALKSSSPVVIAGPDANISAILALIATAVVTKSAASASSATVFTTLWIMLAVSSLMAGIFLFIVGKFKLGRWIRFIPYPVVGGFLAGTGWLLVRGSFKVMCGQPLSIKTLGALARPDAYLHWLPGALFAVALLIVLRRWRHFLIMPGALIAGIVVSHSALIISGMPLDKAMQQGWLLSPFPGDVFIRTFTSLSFSGFDVSLLMGNFANLAALMIVVAIVILLNAASVELTTKRDMELNRELIATGIANALAAPLAGMTGCMALSRTILNFKAGATNRIAGIVSALLCGVLLVFGAQALSLFPRPVLGGLLLYLGLGLLAEWVWDGWKKLSRLDYFLVCVIIVIIAVAGFLPGVGIGLVIACLFFAINYGRVGAVRQVLSGAQCHSNIERSFKRQQALHERGEAIYIVKLQGYIFFGTAYPLLVHIQDRLRSADRPHVRFVVLDFSGVSSLDSSSIMSFAKLLQCSQACGALTLFAGMSDDIAAHLLQGKCLEATSNGPRPGMGIAAVDLDHALGFCEDRLLSEEDPAHQEESASFAEFFAHLFPKPELVPRLMGYLERIETDAGYVLFRESEPSTDLYFVESGEVTALLMLPAASGPQAPESARAKIRTPVTPQPFGKTAFLETGRARRLRTMGAGTVIGEMGLFMNTPRSATVVTEKKSVLYRLTAESLKKIEAEDLALACALDRFFIGLLANRLVHANAEIAMSGR